MPMPRTTAIGPEHGGNFEYEWESPHVQVHLVSDVGKKRAHNEDSCILSVPEDPAEATERGIVFGVADGMGGASAGELASRLTLDTIAGAIDSCTQENVPTCLRSAVEAANLRVFEQARDNPAYHGMGTTACVALLHGDRAYVVHVGDSRLYVARQGVPLYQVTHDHSIVAEQVRHGLLTEEEARDHCLKNLITRAVGIKETVKTDLYAFQVKRGDTILVCSDGLCNMVNDEALGESLAIKSLQGAARKLVGLALEGGGTDNITAALLRVTGVPPKKPLQEGAEPVTLPRPGLLGRLSRLFG